MRIDVRIDRILLDGIPLTAAQAGRLGPAIEAELGRLLATGDSWPEHGRHLTRIGGPAVRLRATGGFGLQAAEPGLAGRIAASLHQSIRAAAS